jgi:hypothetical protein
MKRRLLFQASAALTFTLLSATLLLAQGFAESSAVQVPDDDQNAAIAPDIIFSNLNPSPDNRFNTAPYTSFPVAGKKANHGQTEQNYAVRFIPQFDVQAKVLMASIGYISGAKLVNLGIYSNNADTGEVGTLLPGGEGSTQQIPDLGECCQLTTVTLPGEGVTLTAGTIYWLVASPDDVRAGNFSGAWQTVYLGKYGELGPPNPWIIHPSTWPGAQIRGTRIRTTTSDLAAPREVAPRGRQDGSSSEVTIFNNLGPAPQVYINTGPLIMGNSVPFQPEVWAALPFTPKANSHAITVSAAIGWVSGTRKVNLGIYADAAGSVGALLPGAQASTTDIPTAGTCCELATVTLPGTGAALTAGTQYWLVASPDNIDAPNFEGYWQDSGWAFSAYQQPQFTFSWFGRSVNWAAATITGTLP